MSPDPLPVAGNHGFSSPSAAFFQDAGTSTFMTSLHAALDGGVVHGDDLLALLAVGLGSGVLHVLDGVVDRDDVGNFEEGGLQNGVDAAAQTDLLADLDTVDGVELDVVLGDDTSSSCRAAACPAPPASQAQLSRKLPPVFRSSTMSYLST